MMLWVIRPLVTLWQKAKDEAEVEATGCFGGLPWGHESNTEGISLMGLRYHLVLLLLSLSELPPKRACSKIVLCDHVEMVDVTFSGLCGSTSSCHVTRLAEASVIKQSLK